MNLFYLDEDPKKCAQMHNNKHCVKMIVELAQMLSTAHRVLDGEVYFELSKSNRKIKRYRLLDNKETILYKATHANHPSCAWVRESSKNYLFTYSLLKELCLEYTHRYGKIHKTESLLDDLNKLPKNIKDGIFYAPPKCMPDYCKVQNVIQSYRNYYKLEKSKFNVYTKRNKPFWL